jgi:Domain of unknown function (DUF4160)
MILTEALSQVTEKVLAKFWLSPIDLAESHGFRSHELKRLRAVMTEHRGAFLDAWNTLSAE